MGIFKKVLKVNGFKVRKSGSLYPDGTTREVNRLTLKGWVKRTEICTTKISVSTEGESLIYNKWRKYETDEEKLQRHREKRLKKLLKDKK